MSSQSINVRLFQQVFEQCPGLAWNKDILKVVLKCIADVKEKKKNPEGDELMPEAKKKEVDESGALSNHQRLQAVEIFASMIKECTQHSHSRDLLAANIELISSVIVRTIETAESWKKKKVSKTIQVVNLFIKAARILSKEAPSSVSTHGAKIIKVIEK
jgi:hypothetical protein